MKKINVTIKGIAPLLQNRFPIEEHGANASKIKKKVYNPEEEAKKCLYKNEDGIYEPSEHIFGALVKAGVKFKFEGKKTYKDIIKAGIVIEPDEIMLKTNKDYESIDSRPVVINRARIVRHRPRFEEWELEFTITIIDDENISPETLKEILEIAGTTGIGDYRPRFGRFQVTKHEEIK